MGSAARSSGSTPKVLVDERQRRSLPGSPDQAWKAVWIFGWLLMLAGLGDTALALVPQRFGVPEWEFGTIASVFAALPLISMGFAAMLASAIARGHRFWVVALGWFLVLMALVVGAAFVVFVSDVPIALSQVQGEVRLGIKKAIVKTAWLGFLFGTAYLIAGIGALRHARRAR